MPSSAEQPHGSRPWWREPLPPEAPEVESSGGPETQVIEATTAAPADTHEHASATARTDDAPPGYSPPPWESGGGPDDATVVMQPVPDATRELPPVPPDPSGFTSTAPPQTDPRQTDPGPAAPGFRPSTPPGTGSPGSAVEVDLDSPPPGPSPVAGGRGGLGDALQRLRPAGGTGRERRSTLVAVGGGGLALLLVVVGAGLLVSRLRNQPPATGTSRTATAIDLTTVRGSATSVQRPDGGITYTVGNTLDGDPSTAWNSDGARDGRGPGISLTYDFATPVDLTRISLRNGYQKVRPNGVDLWERNERIKRLLVVTDSGQWTWDLEDVKEPQTLAQTFGRTRSVRLKILEVYASSKYTDVAISEIAFTGFRVP